jgi:hypothetical protein
VRQAGMNGGPPAGDAFHTPSRPVDDELQALRDEVACLRGQLGSCKTELEAARSASRGACSAADATLQPEPEPPAEPPASRGMPPFAWALLILGLFCNGLGGHLEVAQTGVHPN